MKASGIRKLNGLVRYFKKGHTFRMNKSTKIVVSTAKNGNLRNEGLKMMDVIIKALT